MLHSVTMAKRAGRPTSAQRPRWSIRAAESPPARIRSMAPKPAGALSSGCSQINPHGHRRGARSTLLCPVHAPPACLEPDHCGSGQLWVPAGQDGHLRERTVPPPRLRLSVIVTKWGRRQTSPRNRQLAVSAAVAAEFRVADMITTKITKTLRDRTHVCAWRCQMRRIGSVARCHWRTASPPAPPSPPLTITTRPAIEPIRSNGKSVIPLPWPAGQWGSLRRWRNVVGVPAIP